MYDHARSATHATTWRAPGSLVMAARGFGFGRNPLRRTSERIEAATVLIAVLAALLAIPLGVSIGTEAHRSSTERAAQLRATSLPVHAVTLADASSMVLAEAASVSDAKVRATWRDEHGVRRTGKVEVASGSAAGTEVTVWIDDEGKVTQAPQSPQGIAVGSVVIGVLVVLASWLLLLLSVRGVRWGLHRLRLRRWHSEWERVGFSWSYR